MNIGLTQRVLYHKGRAYDAIEHGWYRFLKGHTLTFIQNNPIQDFEKLAGSIDALIITGGDDSKIRRTTELALASCMMMRQKPIIGVCHGALLLTSVLDGYIEDVEEHADTEHEILYFGDVVTVNSHHNMAIKELHETGTVLCTDHEGNCEAWIDRNMAGVMWHPERMITPWLPDEIQEMIK